MADLNRTPLSHPETPADALEVLDILVRAYVPKNTMDAKYMMGALNVLRVDAARTNAATRVMLGIELGRMAQCAGLPREAMKDEPQRIGWDEAQHAAGAVTCPHVPGATCADRAECAGDGGCVRKWPRQRISPQANLAPQLNRDADEILRELIACSTASSLPDLERRTAAVWTRARAYVAGVSAPPRNTLSPSPTDAAEKKGTP